MRKLRLAALFALCPLALLAGPQTLILRDGRTVSGTFVSGSGSSIVFRDDNGVRHQYSTGEIQSIDFTGNSAAYNPSRNAAGGGYANRAAMGQSTVAGARDLAAGTEITVRTNENIKSDVANSGQTYSAVIDRDVMDASGAVAIPRGSTAQLVIRDVSSGGATSSANLALDLQSVSVNGRNYLVSTEDVQRSGNSGLGANRRTATMVGGGAALGTLLGAIAGGGKGAAIGAVAGAATGGTAQVLTRGKTVNVPAETQLTFRLDQALRLVPR
jgi:hypothetical protein